MSNSFFMKSGLTGLGLALALLAPAAHAATFTVTSAADSGPNTLRDAIAQANANPDADIINFDASLNTAPGVATISLSTSGDATQGPSALAISTPVTISGPANPTGNTGITIARDAGTANLRLFIVKAGGNLTLNNLSLINGKAIGANGSGNGVGGQPGLGGAIFNSATLTVNASTLSGNNATGGNGSASTSAVNSTVNGTDGGFGVGGGGGQRFGLGGTSEIAGGDGGSGGGNNRRGGGGGGAGIGGAIYNAPGATATVNNSTLSGNSTTGGSGGAGFGGGNAGSAGSGRGAGIFNHNGALSIDSSTLNANTLPGNGSPSGAALYIYDTAAGTATATLGNSIFSNSVNGNDVRNVNGAVTLSSTNIIESSQGLPAGSVTTDPALGALAANGGPTRTHAISAGGPAVNTGATALTTDQRGVSRIQGSGDDIGAYELQTNTFTLAVKGGSPSSFLENDEGTATTLVLTRTGDVSSAVTVELRSSNPKEATVPASVTFDAGQDTVEFDVTAVNDTLVDGDKVVTIQARGNNNYFAATVNLTVQNATTPQLTAVLKPAAFYEDAATGPTLTVTHNLEDTSVAVPFTVTSDDPRVADTTGSIPAGKRTVTIPLTVTADAAVQGSKPVQITVDDNAFTTDFTPVVANGVIYDRQAKLTVTASPTLISESGANGKPTTTTFTIARNGDTDLAVTVTLSFRAGAADATLTSTTVTIPAGASSVTVDATAIADGDTGSEQLQITAKAPGYITANSNTVIIVD